MSQPRFNAPAHKTLAQMHDEIEALRLELAETSTDMSMPVRDWHVYRDETVRRLRRMERERMNALMAKMQKA